MAGLSDDLNLLRYIRDRAHGPGQDLVWELLEEQIARVEKEHNVVVYYDENIRGYLAKSEKTAGKPKKSSRVKK